MDEIVATFTHLARQSSNISQRSGVSVRLTVTNRETLVANAVRRSLRLGEDVVAPRVSDLDALAASTMGKVEIESFEEGREGDIIEKLLRQAILVVFRERVGTGAAAAVVDAFDDGEVLHVGEDVTVADYAARLAERPGLAGLVDELAGEGADDTGAGQRRRAGARGPPPVEAPQQGRRRRPGHLPGPLTSDRVRAGTSGTDGPGRRTHPHRPVDARASTRAARAGAQRMPEAVQTAASPTRRRPPGQLRQPGGGRSRGSGSGACPPAGRRGGR